YCYWALCPIYCFCSRLYCSGICPLFKHVLIYDFIRHGYCYSVYHYLFYLQTKYPWIICSAGRVNSHCLCQYVSNRIITITAIITESMVIYPYNYRRFITGDFRRSEEHTSELQSRFDIVCRLLLEKKKMRSDTERLITDILHRVAVPTLSAHACLTGREWVPRSLSRRIHPGWLGCRLRSAGLILPG